MFSKISLFKENFRISLDSIRSHKVRSVLTIVIIAIGITALIGILTAIDSIEYYLLDNFRSMGANTISIQRNYNKSSNTKSKNSNLYREITYFEATSFKQNFKKDATTSVFAQFSSMATLKYGDNKTNPNITVIGSDNDYIITSANEIEKGRFFSNDESNRGSQVIVIGSRVMKKLFPDVANPVGENILVGGVRYQVVGIMKERGGKMGFNPDNICIVPLLNAKQKFPAKSIEYVINILVSNPENIEVISDEATGLFRIIRKDRIGEENSFEISKSDSMAESLFDNLKYIRYAATVIGIITLLGAAVGLMNIMFVSVKERTREIGIRKALGATNKVVRNQFLTESIIIAQLGGISGIIVGILIGNILALSIGSRFVIPWQWVLIGIISCFVVALLSGIIPALKAAKLEPVDALRYE